jgi:hypothetical protein
VKKKFHACRFGTDLRLRVSLMMIERGGHHIEHELAGEKKHVLVRKTENKKCPSVIRPPSVIVISK